VTPQQTAARVRNVLAGLPAPDRGFGSDNQAGAHPAVVAAIAAANTGHVVGYGDDPWTASATGAFRDLFGGETSVLFVWNGTGANVLSLAVLLPRWGAVLTPKLAHVESDEQGAPEAFLGAKVIGVPTPDGKLTAAHIDAAMDGAYSPHHVTPRVVSITQSTENGRLYTADEVGAICESAHRHGLFVHVDGARIANATAALDQHVRAHTFDAGVDALSFGGTKNGLLFGEAVLLRRPEHALAGEMLRKQATQLASKMRFIGAQFEALLRDDLWLRSGAHANAMATRLATATRDVVTLQSPTFVNSLYPVVPEAVIAPLQEWSQHYTWDAAARQVRWVTSWDTTMDDVERFAAGVRAAVTAAGNRDAQVSRSGRTT
jgi:threonine aldolase